MSHLELYQILALALAILVSGYFSEIWPDWAPAKFLAEFAGLGRCQYSGSIFSVNYG